MKAMKKRDVVKALRRNGVEVKRQGKGDHEVWECTCGERHSVVVTDTRELSPGGGPTGDPEPAVSSEGMVAMTTYQVRARRWKHGWELHIAGEGVTQVRTLDKAEQQVRDYLETVREADLGEVQIKIVPDLDGLEREVAAMREELAAAAEAQRRAAEHSRKVVRELRGRGLSVTDTAAVLGVSRGRVSQLAGQ